MKQILVYGDSVSWGIMPGTRRRFDFATRWPGALEHALNAADENVRVVENCLNGRRTVWDDPFRPGRNGAAGLAEAVELNAPLALVVIALGTNDFQATHAIGAWASAQGVGRLVDIVRRAPAEPGMPQPGIVVVAPPAIVEPKGENVLKFEGAAARSIGFAAALAAIAAARAVGCFDMNTVTSASPVDGIHLDAEQHAAVAQAMADVVRPFLWSA